MNPAHPSTSRLRELAAERATLGLEGDEAAEFDALLRGADQRERDEIDELELAAASVHLAFLPAGSDPPADLAERLRRRAELALGPAPKAQAPAERAWYAQPWTGWLVAAIALVIAFGPKLVPGPAPLPASERMRGLVESAPDLLRAEWTPGPDVLGEAVSGTLVWSAERQEGYMRFVRLPRNDARELQYQLWIFDARRADPPIDGGVFDIDADGEVVIPIEAKLEVFEPHLFAITAEPRGGVVVSTRERIVALAKQG